MTKPAFPTSAIIALAVAACNPESEQKEYEVGASDEGGGELIAREPDPEEVDVDLPETPMTPVPEGTGTLAEEDSATDE